MVASTWRHAALPQVLDQRCRARAAFGFTSQNLPQVGAEVVCRISAPHSLPVSRDVPLDQAAAGAAGGLHALRRDAVDVDQLVVVAVDEVAVEVEHIGEAAGEAGAEVQAGAAEHARRRRRSCTRSSGRPRPRPPRWRRNCAPRSARRRWPAANSSPPVAPYRQVLPMITVSLRDDSARSRGGWSTILPAGHALADVVVGIAFQVQVQAAGVPGAEALAGRCR